MTKKVSFYKQGYLLDTVTGTVEYVPWATEEFAMVVKKALYELSRARNIWGTARAILDYLLADLNREDQCAYVTRQEIALFLGIHVNEVSRNISKLIEAGFIIKGQRLGRQTQYYLGENLVRRPASNKSRKNIEKEIDARCEAYKKDLLRQINDKGLH